MTAARPYGRIVLGCFVVLIAACGSPRRPEPDLSAPSVDFAVDFSEAPPTDAGSRVCKTSSDCLAPGVVCGYAVADGCSATSGICISRASGPSCGALRILCGCGGKHIDGDGDCNFPVGYASGPTLYLGPCTDDAGDSGDAGG